MAETRGTSKLAWFAGALGCFALGWVLAGFALRQLEWVSAMRCFTLFYQLGSLTGFVAFLCGLGALYTTRRASARAGRTRATLGIACGGLLTGAFVAALLPVLMSSVPPLNDISTDLDDAPQFTSDPAARGRNMSFPPPAYPRDWRVQLRAAYPELAPLESSATPEQALDAATNTARRLGWRVVHVDRAAGVIQAEHRTRLFRFVDDVLIRVRATDGGGARLDLRSKSRDGISDLGTNAARIQSFAAVFPE